MAGLLFTPLIQIDLDGLEEFSGNYGRPLSRWARCTVARSGYLNDSVSLIIVQHCSRIRDLKDSLDKRPYRISFTHSLLHLYFTVE